MKLLKTCCIFGTRPEIIKMAPVIHELQKHTDRVLTHTVCSGQHRELLYPLIDWFDLTVDINLDVMEPNQNLSKLGSKILSELGALFEKEKYDCVIAQGDTTTVLMSAIAAFYAKIPFVHVEAGLRTFDPYLPFPEEMNRILAARIAALHFAPTEQSAENLQREGIHENTIIITGNTVIDALHYTTNKLQTHLISQEKKTILVTAHRRENFGEPLRKICNALLKISRLFPEVEIIFPMHPNPNVRETVNAILGNISNITLIEPLPYDQLIRLMATAHFTITDSGGIQEEAPALKKPVLVLREETERPELVKLGGAILVGSDEALIIEWTKKLLTCKESYQKMVLGYSPYGSGKAAETIVKKTLQMLCEKTL